MRDKSTGIAIAFAIIALVFGFAFLVNGVIGGQIVASSDVTVQDSNPTVNDDLGRGYLPGYTWINQTNSTSWQAISTDDGVALWVQTNINNTVLGSEYGNLYSNGGGAQVLATAGAFEILDNMDVAGDSTANITLDTVAHDITIVKAGNYLISYSATFSGSANREFHLAAFLDGVILEASEVHRTMSASGAVGVVADTTITASITSGQVLDLRAAPEVNSDSITLEHGSLVVVELPE